MNKGKLRPKRFRQKEKIETQKIFLYIYYLFYSTNRIIKYGLAFPLSLVLLVSLAFSVEYSKGQSMTDVSEFTTRPDIGTEEEEEPTIKDDVNEEETIKDDAKDDLKVKEDEPEPEPTNEEEKDNDTVTTVPLKRPTGTDLGLDNLTTAPGEGPGKLIFSSCKIYGPISWLSERCDVAGAMPGDNVIVSSTNLDGDNYYLCHWVRSAEILKPNIVTIRIQGCSDYQDTNNIPPDYVIFSIIVFRPMEFLRPDEELPEGLSK